MTVRKRHDILTQHEDPSVRQRLAAAPGESVWVSASAGTGKTKVLTDRTLRLLLPREDGRPGTKPGRILCLTYTKAAASEMALRINKTLSLWATESDERLDEDLYALLGRPANDSETQAARRLFARVVDAPGGLKIITIHSFCQSVLGRFPLEAGLPPHFTTLEEAESRALLTAARDSILAKAQARPETALGMALIHLATEQTEDQFNSLLRSLTAERHQLQDIIARLTESEGFYDLLCRTLDVHPDDTPDSLRLRMCSDDHLDAAGLWEACRHLATGTKTDQERGIAMQAWLERDNVERIDLLPQWRIAFLTREGEPRKSLMTKALMNAYPDSERALRVEAEQLVAGIERINACRCAQLTHDLVIIGTAIAEQYQALKDRRAALDFDDLIHRTRALLKKSRMAGWVLYKLDEGLDHILIDEAQDTNPEQWDIVEALAEEFFAGSGAREDIRTLFTVGDEKQSIYSFQRAAPEKFTIKKQEFKARIEAANHIWTDVALDTSFRSTPSVLDFVDSVFTAPETLAGMGDQALRHVSWRHGHAGRVELWPLFKVAPPDKADAWEPAVTVRNSHKSPALLAEHIAETIAGWMKHGEMLLSQGRPIQPGDVLVLVRRRSAFVTHLIRALKKYDVPVSGVDRMVLNAQLSVQDLLAVAQVALLPEDDLSLACVLKSPFIGFDDARLEALALGRGREETLWDALRTSNEREALAWLDAQVRQAGTDHPYEFFSRLLQSPCPANAVSGLHAISARLGDEALDPLNEFLNQALHFERGQIAALQLFLLAQQQGDADIKREQEEAGTKVRIMTIHAAKGLQAPIVFLPDTVRQSRAGHGSGDRLLWPDKTGLPVPLWSPRKGDDSKPYRQAQARVQEREDQEYRRLLYVAMTRAEDRLYIGGYEGRNKALPDSWYTLMQQAFDLFEDAEAVEAQAPEGLDMGDKPYSVTRLNNPQQAEPRNRSYDRPVAGRDESHAYDWLHTRPRAEPMPPRPLAPSRPSEPEPPAQSPLHQADNYRFRRGLLTHRLLQTLPDLPPGRQEDAAMAFIGQKAHDLPIEVQAEIVRETMAVLRHPDYGALFGPDSQAEVPVTGHVGGQLISAQIDRLMVTDDAVWIVDFKTNRPPPLDVGRVPDIYRRQLRAYRETLAAIYPNRTVRTFLLWTEGARLMEVDTVDI